jgi:hypothetical protein
MNSPLLNHFLIGFSDRAQSDFAESVLTPLCQDAVIISPDPVPEASKEEEILDQVESAIAQGNSVIYKAGKVERPERLDWLQKVKHRIGDSHQWIAWYLESPEIKTKPKQDRTPLEISLKTFPPHPAEGFVKVETLDASKLKTVEKKVSDVLRTLQRSRTQQQNRYSNYDLHRYSAFLDFERLMHLIALIVKYPGIGKLRETEPETVQTILGKHPSEIVDDTAEICELMALLKGRVYADPSAIAQDLDWLDHHHFFTTAAVNSRVRVKP